jgi:hypothetical protein
VIGREAIASLQADIARVGYARAIERSLYDTANRFVCLRRLDVIRLSRDELEPLPPTQANIVSRIATETDLLAMQAAGIWNIGDDNLAGFRAGDRCLLSYVDNKLAGYTWIHTRSRPLLIPRLRLRIPDDYLYNFAGFTAPAFRGFGLQGHRHHAILERDEWRDRKGLLGYVQCVNWSSRRGQSKSGYRPLGSIVLVGTHDHFAVLLSSELEALGIRRLDA